MTIHWTDKFMSKQFPHSVVKGLILELIEHGISDSELLDLLVRLGLSNDDITALGYDPYLDEPDLVCRELLLDDYFKEETIMSKRTISYADIYGNSGQEITIAFDSLYGEDVAVRLSKLPSDTDDLIEAIDKALADIPFDYVFADFTIDITDNDEDD